MLKFSNWFVFAASFLVFFESPGVVMLTEDEINAVVDRHNYHRSREEASNMQKMKWNQYLADMAAEWVSGCVFEHGQPPRDEKEVPFEWIGQNLYKVTGGKDDLPKVTDVWFDEKKYFNLDSNSCEKDRVCGHYTQVVWSSSSDLGCGVAYCDSGDEQWWFSACNYGPGGNVVGEKPYEKGPACSKCKDKQLCEDEMCKD